MIGPPFEAASGQRVDTSDHDPDRRVPDRRGRADGTETDTRLLAPILCIER